MMMILRRSVSFYLDEDGDGDDGGGGVDDA